MLSNGLKKNRRIYSSELPLNTNLSSTPATLNSSLHLFCRFLVGTEEGRIHACSLEYTAKYQATYTGHTMAVYAVKWNSYHPRVFISASNGAQLLVCWGCDVAIYSMI